MPVPAETRERATTPPEDSPATLGLLTYITRHALEDDYRTRHEQGAPEDGPEEGAGSRVSRSIGGPVLTLAALALFALLLITAATQTSRNAGSDQHEREALIKEIHQRQSQVNAQDARVAHLQQRIDVLGNSAVQRGRLNAGTRAKLQRLATDAGTVPVTGEGIVVTVDDAADSDNARSKVLDTDLQQLVNGLWQAGAEAVSIDDQRITSLSAIREAGSAITVNYRSLDRPYVVKAIGDPETLPARFAQTESGAAWLDLHQQLGLVLDMRTSESLTLPGMGRKTLRYAVPTQERTR